MIEMRIMTVMYTLRKGGAYDRFIMMMEAFLERGCEVHCLSLTPIQINSPFYRNHMLFARFRINNRWVARMIVMTLFPLYSLLIGWRDKIDLFIAFSLLYAFIQTVAKRTLKKPMVTFVRSELAFHLKTRNPSKCYIFLSRVIEYVGMISSDRILTVNKGIQQEISKTVDSPKKVEVDVLFNNIPAMNGPVEEELHGVRAKYGIPKEARIVVTASMINRGKNIETLIRGFSKVKTGALILLVVGEGAKNSDSRYQDHLRKLTEQLGIGKQVIFTGWLSKNELWNVFRIAQLFILPSLKEGMPNVMLEALGLGLSCIGSRIPGNADVLRDEELMFDPLDAKALAGKIDRFFSDRHYSNVVLDLCRKRKEVFLFNWKERAFQTATAGFLS
jgi:glycosyltransferase involved in cell wall biosynthesis